MQKKGVSPMHKQWGYISLYSSTDMAVVFRLNSFQTWYHVDDKMVGILFFLQINILIW